MPEQNFFYPASGCRAGGSGTLLVVGENGYSWSCSPNSTTTVLGSDLHTSNSHVYPEYTNDRASGFPVRCVKE